MNLTLVNGCVRPGPDFSRRMDTLTVRDGLVARNEAPGAECGDSHAAERIDLRGACVLPGFIDTHLHLMATGVGLSALSLAEATSVAQVLDLLREAPSGDSEWVVAGGLDESKLADGRLPTRDELDSVQPRRPLFVDDRGLHYALLNSPAWRRLDPSGALLGPHLDARGGARLSEGASGVARKALAGVMERSARRAALLRGAELAVSVGLTSVHAIEGGELFSDDDFEVVLENLDRLPLHVLPFWSTDDVQRVSARGLVRMGGDILCDGSLGARTAALLENYLDRPAWRGEHLRDSTAIQALIARAEESQIQVGLHAIGDRAVREALLGIEAALAGGPNRLRHRIDHFGIVAAQDLERAARLQVAIATQPSFMAMRGGPGGVYEQRLGPERVRRTYPLRDFLSAGLHVGGGSDSPVGPIAPLVGIQSALLHPIPDQRVDLSTALRLYLSEAAWLGGEEHQRGTLEPGKSADFVILARDPFTVPADEVAQIPILATYVAGQRVFGTL